MSRLYSVQTEKFGMLTLSADNIAEARDIAKKRYKAGPKAVTAHQEYRRCDDCGCKPCCCGR